MGRTVPSFRIAIADEKQEWKTFRNALDKSERKEFDEMWDIPRLYISACSNSVQLVPLHPIIISILFHHFKELKECISEVEQAIEANSASDNNSNNSKKIDQLTINEEEGEARKETKEIPAAALDRFIFF